MHEDKPRLIEVSFPLKQTSLDSVHEKNVRHGHISTLHIWPARRPLAACRAALIATLLPDPGNDIDRKLLLEKMGGVVKTKNTFKNVGGRKIPVIQEYTEGGILHWGRESNPDIDFFREEIRKAYGGRAPRVLDPFAGGGAIPLEAMRLGCEATAVDINPVAWFILKCTLEYPQRLAGQKRPLPQFAINSPKFMKEYLKTAGDGKKSKNKDEPSSQPSMLEAPEADLAWHVRAWGHWVLDQARKDLDCFYPTIDGKPTVAYLWARTVNCKNCRATIPLLKTLWLCKKDKKRLRLKMKPNEHGTGVEFEIVEEPQVGSNAAQRRAHDQEISRGTMSRSGVWCPVCGNQHTVAMTMEDIKSEAIAGRLGAQMTAVVVDEKKGKGYRLPVKEDNEAVKEASRHVDTVFKEIPFGLPTEPTPKGGGSGAGRAFSVQNYGMDQWYKLFSPRQLVALAYFVRYTRAAPDAMRAQGYSEEWVEALSSYLSCIFSRTIDYMAVLCVWEPSAEEVKHVFMRWALPITWDYAEGNPLAPVERFYLGGINSAYRVLSSLQAGSASNSATIKPTVLKKSAINLETENQYDVVFTDPPYYDAIPYSDLMDFFYVWLRRTVNDSPEFSEVLGPKWDNEKCDGELIDDDSRQNGSRRLSIAIYEDGMRRAFLESWRHLKPDGRLVVVFANKNPQAWESLVTAIISAGFCSDGSWPIITEMPGGIRNLNRASLASSIWLICRKRAESARPGWDNQVLEEMKNRIYERLRYFWDAGIRGPDFVWAATGPAMESYSKYPIVKKADQPEAIMTVGEFLKHVRRIVVDYVVGRVLSGNGDGQAAEGTDDPTLYYLLHRHDFGLEEAPVGACILYAQSCNLSDRDLIDRYDLLAHGKSKAAIEAEQDLEESEEAETEGEVEQDKSSSTVRLKHWNQRIRKDLGMNVGGRTAPLIDRVHRIMRLWKAGDAQQVDTYIEDQGLRRNPLFSKLLQALIQLADNQPDERTILESIMNHITATGAHPQMYQIRMPHDEEVNDG